MNSIKYKKMAQFKVLVYQNNYVDESLLYKGIYSTNLPLLRGINTTIDGMVSGLKMMTDIEGNPMLGETYFENLQLCEYVTVELNVVPNGN